MLLLLISICATSATQSTSTDSNNDVIDDKIHIRNTININSSNNDVTDDKRSPIFF